MHKHTNFILSSITDILYEVAAINIAIGSGIETYPLSEYILQSIFLRMTGFQEQKMKCICWELATNDYEYRYKRFSRNPLGECSKYDEKQIVYKDLLKALTNIEPNFDITKEIDRRVIRKKTVNELKKIFLNSNLASWAESNFFDFLQDHTNIIQNHFFATNENLLENVLQDKYKLLYEHRNRIAHNTHSYQQNLPTLKTLREKEHIYDNYVMRFVLLILIDEIFIETYKKYLQIFDNN